MLCATLAITSAAALMRYAGAPLIWADEAAVSTMVWSGFLGAAALFGTRGHMAIDILARRLPPRTAAALALAADLAVLAFFTGLCALTWTWFDLPGLLRAGSPGALARESFNYLYLEPTQTLGIRKLWIWLVLPLFALGGTVHALSAVTSRLQGSAA